MFLTATKTVIVEAVRGLFDAEFPEEDFRNIWVSQEYPKDQANYPGIWVDFDTTADVQTAGIGHVEYVASDTGTGVRKVGRWRFAGMITLTMVAMTSLERDRLADALGMAVAFGLEDDTTSEFRRYIEHNDLVGLQVQWDKFALTGKAESPGTPWGTDDVVYEITMTLDCQGEFISSGSMGSLIPLSAIVVYEQADNDPPPPPGLGAPAGLAAPLAPSAPDPTDLTGWH